MVFGYGAFGVTPAVRVAPLDRSSLLKMGVPALTDLVASLDATLKTTQADLATRTQERDTAVTQRESFRQQAALVPGLKQQADLVPVLQQRVNSLNQQASLVPGLQETARQLKAVADQVPALREQASLIPGLKEQAALVPVLQQRVDTLNQQASLVPGLREETRIAQAQRDTVAATLATRTQERDVEAVKARNFEAAAGKLKIDADALQANLTGVTQALAQVKSALDARSAEVQKLSADVQSERGSRLSAESLAEARGGELTNTKALLAQALADKDSSLAAAAQQWKAQLDSALASAKSTLEAERESARKERGQVEEQKQSLGQKYEELLKKYNEVVAELEAARAKTCPTCPVCPVCQDCPAPQPCPECGKASTKSASTDSGSSAWTLLLALGGGYLVGKNIGK